MEKHTEENPRDWFEKREGGESDNVVTIEPVSRGQEKQKRGERQKIGGLETRASTLHPNRNEDAGFAEENIGVGVFDGVGGDVAGDIASQTVAEYVLTAMKDLDPKDHPASTEQHLVEILDDAQQELIAKGQKIGLKGKEKLATTAVIAQTVQRGEKKYLVYAWTGDSRLYVLKNNGRLIPITQDTGMLWLDLNDNSDPQMDQHYAQMISWWLDNAQSRGDVNAMSVKNQKDMFSQFGEEWPFVLAYYWDNRHLVSSVLTSDASRNANIQSDIHVVMSEDLGFIALSDGIHDNLTSRQMNRIAQSVISEGGSMDQVIKQLVKQARLVSLNKQNPRSKADDITAGGLLFA